MLLILFNFKNKDMQAGKYYVGDLCYVLHDRWDEVCDLIIKDNVCLDGEFELKDGTQFAIYGTAHGDGHYPDQRGNGYPVDSGSIGCVLVDSITKGELDESLGNIHDFKEDFETGEDDGLIQIGDVEIDTKGEEEDEEEDEDY
ncbi:hypothetical protein UFOVP1247_58 [uncultured Caudovirales phage]|uniref:Uncharacterized protein n=1 Tax=uncultured Caudovirales phage TaxID=2100421 RepID=A0A6J5RGH1_9CAUD|nr:hypothetical protein UFOVP970_98 [uncultured Caudovirales phage]CAB4193327.1 hypothetical protein UFOVP1247_58 [uncultured Caudovirales phage]